MVLFLELNLSRNTDQARLQSLKRNIVEVDGYNALS